MKAGQKKVSRVGRKKQFLKTFEYWIGSDKVVGNANDICRETALNSPSYVRSILEEMTDEGLLKKIPLYNGNRQFSFYYHLPALYIQQLRFWD